MQVRLQTTDIMEDLATPWDISAGMIICVGVDGRYSNINTFGFDSLFTVIYYRFQGTGTYAPMQNYLIAVFRLLLFEFTNNDCHTTLNF